MKTFITPKNAQITKIDGEVQLSTDLKIINLGLGDQLIAGESLAMEEGASLTLKYADGMTQVLTFNDLTEAQAVDNKVTDNAIDALLEATENNEATTADEQEIAALQSLIESGEGDLDLPATAAGTANSGGGTGFTSVDRTAGETLASAGFDTDGLANQAQDVFDQTENNGIIPVELFAPSITFNQDINVDEILNAAEAGEQATVIIGLTDTNASAGDTLFVNNQSITLTQAQVDAAQVEVFLPLPTPDAPIDVVASLEGFLGNTSPESNDQIGFDSVGPTLSITGTDADSENNNSSDITFSFSESVTNFEFDDIVVVGGVLSNFQQIDDQTWTATFTPNAGDEINSTISVANDTYTDIAGNPGTGDVLEIIDLPPSITIEALKDLNENEVVVGDKVADFSASDREDGVLTDQVILAPGTNEDGYYAIENNVVVITPAGVEAINSGVILPPIVVQVTDRNGITSTATDTPFYNEQDDIPNLTPDFGSVTEDVVDVNENLVASGTLAPGTDGDVGEDKFTPQTIEGTYGSLTLNSDGQWVYTAANNQPEIQQLNVNSTPLEEIFVVTNIDGVTTTTVTIQINGADDGSVIVVEGDDSDLGSVTEDVNVVNNLLSTNGTLTITDIDTLNPTFSTVIIPSDTNYLGELVINSNGEWTFNVDNTLPAVQALNSGQVITQTYTVTSSDGKDTHLITININGADDALPSITGVDENGVAPGDVSVNEIAGSTVSGSFEVDAQAGIDSITFAGVDLNTLTSPTTVNGAYGTLTINPLINGTISYTYVQTAGAQQHNASNSNITDEFSITVSDIIGRTTSSSLLVNVTDSVPNAVIDNNPTLLVEDDAGNSHAQGSILTNDSFGADGGSFTQIQGNSPSPTSITAGITVVQGKYGTLEIDASGNYTYTVDNSLSATQALVESQQATETFTYVLTDGDNDTDAATLNFTIIGAQDDGPTITGVDENGLALGDVSVVEIAGSITSGSFEVDAQVDISSVIFAGVDITNLAGPVLVPGAYGTLTINPMVNGTVSYSYLQTAGAQSHNTTDSNINDIFDIVVTDIANQKTNASLTVNITDTQPSATIDNDPTTLTEDSLTENQAQGTVLNNDSLGEDGSSVTQVHGLANKDIATSGNTLVQGKYGTLEIDANGNYTYTVDNTLAATQSLAENQKGTETFTYTLTDGDKDSSSNTLNFSINGSVDNRPTITGVDENGLDLGDVSVAEIAGNTTSGSFEVDAQVAISTVEFAGVDITNITSNVTVIGSYGTLTIFPMVGGTVSYSYEQTQGAQQHNAANDNINDVFAISVTDIANQTTSSTLTVNITDTAPVANIDNDLTPLTEDSSSNNQATGSVLTNDTVSEDATSVTEVQGVLPTATVVSANGTTTIQGKYGTLVIEANGSYTYTVDNSLPATQALNPNLKATETFNYVIKDSDNDSASSTLNFNINGAADNKPTITIVDENGALAGDFNVSEDLNNATGAKTFNVTASAGIASITLTDASNALIDITDATIAAPVTVTGTYGTITVTDVTNGVVTYTYSENAGALVHTSADEHVDNFAVTVTDLAGQVSASNSDHTLSVRVTDEEAVAANDIATDAVIEDDATKNSATGNVINPDNSQTGELGEDTLTGDSASVTAITSTSGESSSVNAAGDLVIDGNYGTLTIKANGDYTYVLDAGKSQALTSTGASEVFTYTLSDKDGITPDSTATLTIALTGSDDDKPTVTIVDENGALAGDFNVSEDLNNATGAKTFNVTASAGIASITLTDASNALIDITDATIAAPVTVTGTYGTITVTDVTNGVVTYTYSENAGALVHTSADEHVDNFAVTVTDLAGQVSASNSDHTLSVRVTDEEAVAANDIATDAVIEDDATKNSATGNVINPDNSQTGELGEDTLTGDSASVTAITSTSGESSSVNAAGDLVIDGNYGTLTIKANGDYTYVLDAGKSQALTSTGASEVFTYTLSDKDGITPDSTATLTIALTGSDEPPSINIPDTNNADVGQINVVETGNTSGSFTFDVEAGVKSIVINTTTVSAVGDTVTTSQGVFTVTAISSTGISYDYVSSQAENHASGDVTDALAITITDNLDRIVNDTLTVNITDTAPRPVKDVAYITEDDALSVSGNVITAVGSDANAEDNADVAGADDFALTKITFTETAQPDVTLNVTAAGTSIDGKYGTLTIYPDGTYTYVLDQEAVVDVGEGDTRTELFSYTIKDTDSVESSTSLTINVFGADEPPKAVNDPQTGFNTLNVDFKNYSQQKVVDLKALGITITAVGTDDTSNSDDIISFSDEGIGIGSGTGGSKESQIEYNPTTGDSEKLSIKLDTPATSMQFDVTRLYANEANNSSDDEQGHWTALYNGVIVSSGTFIGTSDTNASGLISLPGLVFDQVIFHASTYTDGTVNGTDASDYLISSISVTKYNDDSAKFVVSEDDVLTLDKAIILQNDTDPDGGPDPLSITHIEGQKLTGQDQTIVLANNQGTINVVNGEIKFTPGSAYDGLSTGETSTATIKYQITDGKFTSNEANIDITIVGVDNNPPTAGDFTVGLGYAASKDFSFAAHVADIEDDTPLIEKDVMVKVDSLPDGKVEIITTDPISGQEVATELKVGDIISENATLRYTAIDETSTTYFNAQSQHTSITNGKFSSSDITISGGEFTKNDDGSANFDNITARNLSYDTGTAAKPELGIGVGSGSSEVETGKNEFINIEFANNVDHIHVELGSLWSHYVSTEQNAIVHIEILKDGQVIGKQAYGNLNAQAQADQGFDSGIYTLDIDINNEFNEVRVYATSTSNSDFVIRNIAVIEESTSDSLTYHAIDSNEATSGASNTVNFTMNPDAPVGEVAPAATGNEDQFIPLTINPVNEDTSRLTIIIKDIPNGATLKNDAGELTVTNGSVSLTLSELDGLAIKPPIHSDVDFSLSVELQTASTVGVASSSIVVSQQVTVNAIADAPELNVNIGTGSFEQELINSNFENSGHKFADEGAYEFGMHIDSIDGWEPVDDPNKGTDDANKVELRRPLDGADDNRFIELNNDPITGGYSDAPSISQTVNTIAGETYTLTFDYAPREYYSADINKMSVSIDGNQLALLSAERQEKGKDKDETFNDDWQSKTVTFIGTGNPMTIELAAAGDDVDNGRGMFIDNIVLSQGNLLIPLNISAALVDDDTSEELDQFITVSNLPAGVTLSAGINDNGTWKLTASDLNDLQIVAPSGATTMSIIVSTSASEKSVSNDAALTTKVINLQVNEDGSVTSDLTAPVDNSLDTQLTGGQFNDIISGGVGDDTIIGGLGDDSLIGGLGNDTYVWLSGDKGVDEISGFDPAQDKIDLSDLLNVNEQEGALDGYLNFRTEGSDTVIDIDVDDDGKAEQSIVLLDVDLESEINGKEVDVLNSLFNSANGNQKLISGADGATYNEPVVKDYDDLNEII